MGFRSSDDAELAGIQLEKDYQAASASLGVLETEMNQMRRKILDMEIRRNDLHESIRKGRENIKRIQSEMRVTNTEFWRLKKSNL